MELLLSILDPTGAALADVVVDVDADHAVADLRRALAGHVGASAEGALWMRRDHVWERLDDDELIDDTGIVSGTAVAFAQPPQVASHHDGAELRLAVTSGPDAGRSFPLRAGDYLVGRGVDCDIRLSDPLVSRSQFILRVSPDGTAEVRPFVDARNPIRIDGQDRSEPLVVEAERVIQAGTTSLCIRPSGEPQHRPRGFGGRLSFHRTPYFRNPVSERLFEPMGDLPRKPKPRRFQFLAALSPLVMGVGMALLIGSPRYLLFAVFSPVIAVGTWIDQRRQGGREYDEAVESFGTRLETRVEEVHDALRQERIMRLHNNPDLELLARRSDSGHNELWQRDRNAEDFLQLRLGVGTGAPAVRIKPETSGDEEFVEEVERSMRHFESIPDIPIALDLVGEGSVAACGEPMDVRSFVSALMIQLATLHSPEDVVVFGAFATRRNDLDWLKWLPHTRASSAPIAGRQLTNDPREADELLRSLASVVESRSSSRDQQVDRRWPWLVVLIDRRLEPDASVVSRILDGGVEAGVSVIWMTDSEARVPRQVASLINCVPMDSSERSVVRHTDVELADQQVDLERIDPDVAAPIARALAPMRDATATNAVTAIPRVVSLFDSLGVSSVTPGWVAEQWATDRGYALTAPIGRTDAGPLVLNLVEHGPHGLIGGTSGAGKSELVQSLVANLAVCNSPEKINFLFVDYKGGALSEMFRDIPHTVGAVTNLDALLALRALTSLTAELDRRMELFKGRAGDIREMIAKYPDEAPASLVIVVDEFAALVRELPEFVDGIVSIAERGRSLGIHLLMSTQRPSGAINDNIQQNTNLRIALRMLDSGESNNVIGAPDAALIPLPLKGRGLARLGPGELMPFQSAWSGAPLLSDAGPAPVRVRPFVVDPTMAAAHRSIAPTAARETGRTQLDEVIEGIVAAASELGLERGRAPWREVLPGLIDLEDLLADPRAVDQGRSSNAVTIAMIDDPRAQDQYPGSLDFVEGGTVAIFGNGGSGKSTLLKTIAASVAIRDSERGGGTASIVAFDFASRALGLLARLPQTAAVVSGDELESVTRHLAVLGDQIEQRRALLAGAAATGDELPEFARIHVLIDGYENMMASFESTLGGREAQRWIDLANQILIEGRQFGIFAAFTAGRRGAVRSNVMSALSNRVVLRQGDESAYIDLGVPSKMARGLELAPGQGFIGRNVAVQFAALGSIDGESELLDDRDAIVDLASRLCGSVLPELTTAPLPAEVPLQARSDRTWTMRLGVADRSLAVVEIDLSYTNLVVLGPPRSGRSTALVTVADQLVRPDRQIWVAGPPGSLLAGFDAAENSAFGRVAELAALLEELADAVEHFPNVERVLVVDDVDLFDDRSMYDPAQRCIDAGVRIVGSVVGLRGFGSNPLYNEMKNARAQVFLQPDGAREVQEVLGVMPDLRAGLALPPGRGVAVADRTPHVVQIASVEVAAGVEVPAGPIAAPTLVETSVGAPASPTPPTPPPSSAPARALALALESGERWLIEDSLVISRQSPDRAEQPGVIALADHYVSARHALVERRGDAAVITDQASRNGTILSPVNGPQQRLEPGVSQVLSAGDEIVAGGCRLRVVAVS